MENIIEFIGMSFDLIGKLTIAYAAIAVHHRFRHEHKVDEEIFNAMRKEQYIAIFGVISLLLGFTLKSVARFIL